MGCIIVLVLLLFPRFESGNLAKAVRITETYYELQLRPDLYTDRHCQWFYFRVQVSQGRQNIPSKGLPIRVCRNDDKIV